MTVDTIGRQRAFIPGPGDEGMFDTLGFWDWGAFQGEWSGTSAWLVDAPLPKDVVGGMPVKDLPANAPAVKDARRAFMAGEVEPVTLLAPVETPGGYIVLPIQGHGYDVNPNFVAHIERSLPGGEWVISNPMVRMNRGHGEHRALIYLVDGQPRGVVAPIPHDAPGVGSEAAR